MILFYLLLIFSFFIEGILPNIFRDYMPLYILSVIVIFNSMNINNKNILISLFIFGIIYDLTYTNFIFIHGFIYMAIYYILNKVLVDTNFFKLILMYYLVILLYTFTILIFPVLLSPDNVLYLIVTMIKSIFFNSIYFVFIYVIFCLFKNKIKSHTY